MSFVCEMRLFFYWKGAFPDDSMPKNLCRLLLGLSQKLCPLESLFGAKQSAETGKKEISGLL